MPLNLYLETMGLIALAIGSAVLGSVFNIEFLSNTVASGLFGAAIAWFGQAARQQVGK